MVSYRSINILNAALAEREHHLTLAGVRLTEPHVRLQTCNRIEVYQGSGVVPPEIVRHLFRVVSGLESGLRGESAIQGQVKQAYEQARLQYQLSTSLHRLFQQALRVGKRVRNESGIGQGAVSHSHATVEMITKSGIDLKDAQFTLIGVNKMVEDTIRFLQNKGARAIFVANRSYHKALPVAQKYGCEITGFDRLTEVLNNTDVLISATSAPQMIIRKNQFPVDKPMMIFDLAFPRDIEPSVAEIDRVRLFNIEDIEASVENNLAVREKEVTLAEAIIEEEISLFEAFKPRHLIKQENEHHN